MIQFIEMQNNIHSRESSHWLHIGKASIVTTLHFGPNPPTRPVNLPLSSLIVDDDHAMEEPVCGA